METIIREQQIRQRVAELAREIHSDYTSSGNELPPVFICILNGSFHFFSDLMKHFTTDCEIDFIRLKSYEGQDNSGGIKCTKELELDLKGKRVYIVDDICDSGATIMEALFMVNSRMPAEVKVVTMLKRKNGTALSDFNGFEIEDEWVVGYGLDNNGLERNQNIIYSI
jgi:hypoxanthine phosphoribosyltransferase